MSDRDIKNWKILFTKEELEFQEVFEAQLKYTANYINRLVDSHPHYTDDCGDYLASALLLSLKMAESRQEGIDSFMEWMKEQQQEEQFHLLENYASDGISPAVYKFFGEE
jgi:hypothetical protein